MKTLDELERDALSPAMRASITREMYRLFDGKAR